MFSGYHPSFCGMHLINEDIKANTVEQLHGSLFEFEMVAALLVFVRKFFSEPR